jgi:hypothetical protein
MATGYMVGGQSSIPGLYDKFSLHSLMADTQAYQASYQTYVVVSFIRRKSSRSWSLQLNPPIAEV